MKKYIEGIRFGMILQLIIGPMCMLVFHTSKNNGFFFTIPLILVIASVDAFYIFLASIGVSKLLENKKIERFLRFFGSSLLIIFGISTILNAFEISIIPGIEIHPTTQNIIIQGLFLALSNPITIMFWGSVLTTKIIEDKMKKKDLFIFCIGLVSATIIFQTGIAMIGSLLSKFIPELLSRLLNISVGIFLIYYGIDRFNNNEKNKEKKKF